MARGTYRPGRTVVVFFMFVALFYGLVALAGEWTPRLGLDLQGGTRITLVANNDNPTEESLQQAASIIDDRVNASGVVEAEVTTQGANIITVEIPGEQAGNLEQTVKRQAQLRFRLVACSSRQTTCGGVPSGQTPGQPTEPTVPGGGVTLPTEPTATEPTGTPKNRASFLPKQGDKKGDKQGGQTEDPSETASPTEEPTTRPGGPLVDKPLQWMDNPDPASVKAYNEYQCPPSGKGALVDDNPDQPLVTCGTGDTAGVKYLLSTAMIEGTALDKASAGIPDQQVDWVVTLEFDGDGTETFAEISRALYGTEKTFAIVLDGRVLSDPTMEGIITNGQAQISGDFNQASAESLATSLKFGALPISFDDSSTQTEVIGPSLAGDQLSAGLYAGGLGLLLVMIYCLLYYRGLGLVVIASLFVAAIATYAMVLLLSKSAGFTLSLPGVAGLIVAIGITADSFIVLFERIRDEMRDGKSMRVAVEAGWARARNTCLAADAVAFLAAIALYIFAAGVVKGFAFALGLATLIDVAVFFWFTHPMVSWLATFGLFNRGHKLSGLDREALGLDPLPTGGKA